MSRIGKKPITIPDGVTVSVDGGQVRVKGKHGEITQGLPPGIVAEVTDGSLLTKRAGDQPRQRAFHGLARALLANCVAGVHEKFEKKLEIIGIGYRASLDGNKLEMSLGHSHPILYDIPGGIDIKVDKQTQISISGIDKQKVGQVAAELRDMRRPDMYKGKGVRYLGERVKQKVGKSGAK